MTSLYNTKMSVSNPRKNSVMLQNLNFKPCKDYFKESGLQFKPAMTLVKNFPGYVSLPQKAQEKHIVAKTLQLDADKASEVSRNRGNKFTLNRPLVFNTVFEQPDRFLLCEDDKGVEWFVSSNPVQTFLSVLDRKVSDDWISFQCKGKYHAVFKRFVQRGKVEAHFSKLLVGRIVPDTPETSRQI